MGKSSLSSGDICVLYLKGKFHISSKNNSRELSNSYGTEEVD